MGCPERMMRAGAPGSPKRAGGVVLLSVLLILALLAALAWQLVTRHSLTIAQARFAFTADLATSYALGGEALARQLMAQEWIDGDNSKDTLLEAWAQPVAPFEIDNGFLEVQVRDLNGCFNLNSLAGTDPARNLSRLKTLLRNRNLPETLADAWKDWVDPDQDITAFGAEDGEYLLAEPPYRTADGPAGHVSEFRLLRDFEPEMWEAIGNTLCVLPTEDLSINVNTASAAVLAALNPALSEAQLEPFIEAQRDYASVAQVTSEFPELADAVDALTVTSEYFEIQVRAQVDDTLAELASVIRRNPADGSITLISRDFGKDFRSLFTVQSDEDAPSS
ncbi:MAG: type II secretion system minor pseudopilin GspK [Pseudomonadales bacterium]